MRRLAGEAASRLALWLALAILAGVGALGYWATAAVVETTAWVDHTHDIIESLEGFRTGMADAEVSGLSYCVTRDESLLPSYERAKAQMRASQADVQNRLVEPTCRAELEAIDPLVHAHFAELDLSIGETRAKGLGFASAPRSNALVVEQVSRIIAKERDTLDIRETETARSVLHARIAQGVGALASLVLFLGAFRRIRRYEEQLRANEEERFRAAIEGSLDAFYTFDAVRDAEGAIVDYRVVDINRRGAKRIGRPSEEIRGRLISELAPRREVRPIVAQYTQVVTTGKALEADVEVAVPGFSISWIHHQIVPLGDGVAVTSSDISERKAKEEALRLSEERFRLFLDGVRDYALFMVDPLGRIVSWNAGAERTLGYAADEIVGASVSELMRPGEKNDPMEVGRVALANGRHDQEGPQFRKDGSKFWASVVTTPIHDEHGLHRGFAIMVRDRTERQTLEEQLRQSQKLEAIGSLAGGIAHDFNNVLSVILTFSALALEQLPSSDSLREDIEEIQTAGLRAVELVRQLLAFSRRQVLEPRLLDLADAVKRSERMLSRLIGEDLRLEVAPASTSMVLVDPGQIDQVIMNLVVNARDAMPTGGRVVIATTDVVVDEAFAAAHENMKPGPHVMLSVSDDGTGMDAETVVRVFEPFFTTKQSGRGTGLGLATVFGIVHQSEGTIWVESKLGVGTKFTIYLPVSERVETLDSAPPPASSTLRGNETILLVEDEAIVRELTRTILERYGYNVLSASDASDALQLSAKYPSGIDLLFTDVVMPNMSGRELAEKLLPLRPAMRVLYMSGYTDDAIVRHGVLDRSIAFIQKPLIPAAVAQKVRAVLALADE